MGAAGLANAQGQAGQITARQAQRKAAGLRLAKLMIVMTVLFFSGAFFEQFLMGSAFSRDISMTTRLLNAAKVIPIYLFAIYWCRRQSTVFAQDMRVFGLIWLYLAYQFLNGAVRPASAIINIAMMVQDGLVLVVASGLAISVSQEVFYRVLGKTLLLICVASLIYIHFIPSYGLMSMAVTLGQPDSNLTGLPQGVFLHKNKLADVMAAGLIVAVGAKGMLDLRLRLALFGLSSYLLIESESANKLAGVVIAFSAIYFWRAMTRLSGNGVAVTLLAVIVILIGLMMIEFILEPSLTLVGKDMTFTGRIYIWGTALRALDLAPIFGYGTASIWNTPLGDIPELPFMTASHAHNTILELALQGGYVGAVLALVALFQLLRRISEARLTRTPAFFIAFMVIVSSAVRSFFEFNFFAGNNFTFLLLLISVIYLVRENAAHTSWAIQAKGRGAQG